MGEIIFLYTLFILPMVKNLSHPSDEIIQMRKDLQ